MILCLLGLVAGMAQAAEPTGPHRVYEIRAAAPIEPDSPAARFTGPFTSPTDLVTFLVHHELDGLAIWLDAAQAPGVVLPREPRTRCFPDPRRLPPGLDDALHELIGQLATHDIQVALGLGLELTQSGPEHRAIVWTEEERETLIARVRRPGLRNHWWCDPTFLHEQVDANAACLSADLLREVEPAFRERQAHLDAIALRLAGPARDRDILQRLPGMIEAVPGLNDAIPAGPDRQTWLRAMLAQSRLASDVARVLGGSEPHRLDVFQNDWVGERVSRRQHTTRRRPPSRMDLDEWAFSATAHPSIAPVALQRPSNLSAPAWDSADADSEGIPTEGLLSTADRHAFRRFAHFRLQAAHEYAWLLATGEDSRRQAAFEALRQSRAAVRELSDDLSPNLEPGGDHQRVLEAKRWRVEPTHWTLHELRGSRRQPVRRVTTWNLDETRYGEWPRAMLDPVGGIDLRGVFSSTQARQLVLTTEIPQPETRTLRLRVDGPFRTGVVLNDLILAQRHPGLQRGPLLLALSLAPALNRLEIELFVQEEADVIAVQLMPVPRQFEGIPLPPTRATRVSEPLARLSHPLALESEVLVVPDVHRDRSTRPGEAEFRVETRAPRRWDLWLHGTAPADRSGQIELLIDEQRHSLVVPPGAGWRWIRLPEPLELDAGGHQLLLRLSEAGVIVDAMHLLITGTQFPRPPPGDGTLADYAWRFDPLGRGHRFDLPTLSDQRVYQRAFTAEQSGHYEVYVWLRGTTALHPGESTQVELITRSLSQRFFLPGGVPVEEWVSVGFLNLSEGDTIQMRAHGEGAPAFLCLIPD